MNAYTRNSSKLVKMNENEQKKNDMIKWKERGRDGRLKKKEFLKTKQKTYATCYCANSNK